jgi:preprotein translocase subunit SecG
MLHSLLVTLHLALCVAIVGLVLIQRGKGADAGAGFGAGASGTVFGARGSATFFSKATAVVATLFFVTSLALTYVAGQPAEAPKSLVESVVTEQPAAPAEMPSPAGMGLGQDDVPVLDNDAPAPQPEQSN